MQSHPPAPHWPPWMAPAAPQPLQHGQYHSWNAYGTPVFFSMGSSSGPHATLQFSDPTARSDATGSMYSAGSHPYTRPVTTLPPGPLDTPPSRNVAVTSPVKSRDPRASREHSYPTMAIEQSLVQPLATPALAYSRPPSIEQVVSPPREQEVRIECTTTPPSQDEAGDRSKSTEKKMHPCWMCHKSFDRPSTLRKHLLVHTGHKAYACDTCGRRFGVLSNLNRHAKKCAQRPVNQGASAQAAVPGSSAEGTTHAEVAAPVEIAAEVAGPSTATTSAIALQAISAPSEQTRGRKRKAAPPTEGDQDDQAAEVSRKERRPRRKKSPMRWVPDSLKLYDLALTNKATPVPLSPVRPFVDSNGKVLEERDSYAPDVHDAPYHPRGWMGRLPGPGLMDTGGGVASTGRLLVF